MNSIVGYRPQLHHYVDEYNKSSLMAESKPSITWDDINTLRHYLSAHKSQDNKASAYLKDILTNAIIIYMSMLIEDKFEGKMNAWTKHLDDNLRRYMEKAS